MNFPIGTQFIIKNKDTIRKDLRGQRCVIKEITPAYYKAIVETGVSIGDTVILKKINFNINYYLYIKNKGWWQF